MKMRTGVVVAISALLAAAAPTAALANGSGDHGKPGDAPGHAISQQHKHQGNGDNGGNGSSSSSASSSSSSSSSRSTAEKQCRSQLEAMGRDAFDALYGTNKNHRNAFGKCVSKQGKTTTNQDQDQSTDNAAKSCWKDRSSDPTAFEQKYGTNKNGRNAFGKCVSEQAKTQHQQSGSGS
jgi:hypothetical protein